MADAAAESATSAIETPQASGSYEPLVFDESMLVIVKGKVQQPKQPDHSESRLLIQKLQAEREKRSDRIKEIKSIEEQLRSNSKGAGTGNKDVLHRLSGLRNERGSVLRQKQAIREELNAVNTVREAIRAGMRELRDKNRNLNPEKVEQEIRDSEFKLAHESLSEQEEKRLHQQIQQLTQVRPLAKKYGELEARLKDSDIQRDSIMKRLQDSDGAIKVLDDQIKEVNGVLDESHAAQQQHLADLPSLQVEKKENYDIMVALRAKMDELRKKNDDELSEFWKRDRAYKAYSRNQRMKKNEERAREREERDKERAEQTDSAMAGVSLEPYHNDVLTCDQLLTYLRSFTAVKEAPKEAAKAVELPAGLKPFRKKGDGDVEDDLFSGMGKKKPQPAKNSKAPEPTLKSTEPAKPKSQKLNHTLDLLQTFMMLKVEVPQSTEQIPATIEKVEATKAEFLVKRQKAKDAPAHSNGHSNGKQAAAAAVAAPEPEEAANEVEAEAEVEEAEDEAEADDEPAAAKAEEAVAEEEVEEAPASATADVAEEEPAAAPAVAEDTEEPVAAAAAPEEVEEEAAPPAALAAPAKGDIVKLAVNALSDAVSISLTVS